jgi:hypothetical protein
VGFVNENVRSELFTIYHHDTLGTYEIVNISSEMWCATVPS